ncbi:MAG: hypothetical protein R6W68_09715 [Ignavibacteriaceae bacterium]
MLSSNYNKYLSVFLVLIGIHSLAVGIGLLIIPLSLLNDFGFENYTESFFQAQGGVFHIAMSAAYFMAGFNTDKSTRIITFIIIVKLIAFIFLISYFLFVSGILLILLSAIGDGLMGLLLLFLFRMSKQKIPGNIFIK